MVQGISILFIAAAIQGFFLAATLGIHKKNMQANHILAVWIGILSLDLLQQVFYLEAYYQSFPEFILLINLLPITYGSFLFLYVHCLLTGRKLTKKDWLHFLPFFLTLIIQIPFFTLSPPERLQLIETMRAGHIPWQIKTFSLFLPVIASIYAIASYKLFLRHTSSGNSELSWLKFMLRLNIGIWLVVWIPVLIPVNNQIMATIIYLLVSFVIYIFGYFSLRQPEIFSKSSFSMEVNQTAVNIQTASNEEPIPKYGENRLPDELRETLWIELENHMQSYSPWRSANLSLAQLSNDTKIASHHISQVLNDHLGLSFNDYLNQYRVKAVCEELSDSKLNLLDIALACGFSSKSSFNAIFKKHTGKTPSEFRKSI